MPVQDLQQSGAARAQEEAAAHSRTVRQRAEVEAQEADRALQALRRELAEAQQETKKARQSAAWNERMIRLHQSDARREASVRS